MKVNKQKKPRRSSRHAVSPVWHPMLKGAVEKLHQEIAQCAEPALPYAVLITDPYSKAVTDYAIGLTEREVRARLKAFTDEVDATRINIDVARSSCAAVVSDRGEKRPS